MSLDGPTETAVLSKRGPRIRNVNGTDMTHVLRAIQGHTTSYEYRWMNGAGSLKGALWDI